MLHTPFWRGCDQGGGNGCQQPGHQEAVRSHRQECELSIEVEWGGGRGGHFDREGRKGVNVSLIVVSLLEIGRLCVTELSIWYLYHTL